jgi:4-hydroxy-3-methylbut-2-enyl diphosphate reductase
MSLPLRLRVELDAGSGFCFGVVYAIELAEELLAERGYLYCLGDIVHNDEEVRRLQRKGLRIIDYEQLAVLRNETVLLRAHGEPPSTYQCALENNLTLLDASCPVVLKLQNRIKTSADRGETIVLFGQPGHAEVRGLLGQTSGQALVIEKPDELPAQSLAPALTLYSQTTKRPADFDRLRRALEGQGHAVRAHNTICRQVSNRDQELRRFARQFDQVVFVAGTKSSNGRLLHQVCQEVNSLTHFVSQAGQLAPAWFRPGQTVGICGATSTPRWLLEQVRDELTRF